MNMDRLRYFSAVVETRNLRKAAEVVGFSAGSMSKAISVLEDELGLKLLRPEGRGIEVTPAGLRVYAASARLLDEYRRFNSQMNERKQPTDPKLRFGSFEVFTSHFFAGLVETSFPHEEILLVEFTPGKIEEAVSGGLIDYGITYLPSPRPQLQLSEIGSFEMSCFGLEKWRSVDITQWPFAVPITAFQIHSSEHSALDLWPVTGPKRSIKYELELLETALQVTAAGLSVLHCPDFVANLFNRNVQPDRRLQRLPSLLKNKVKRQKIFSPLEKTTLKVL